MSSDTYRRLRGPVVLAALTLLAIGAVLPAAATPTGIITRPANGGVYTTAGITSIAGTAAPTSGYTLTEVRCALGRTVSGSWQYWNWTTQQWGAWDYSQCRKLATGTSNWSVTSGLPAAWNPGSYGAFAYVSDSSSTASYLVSSSYFTVASSDTTPPQVAVTYPAQNQWYYPGPSRLAGTASDASGIAQVQVYLAWSDPSLGTWRYWNWQTKAWDAGPSAACRVTASGKENWEVTGGFPTWLQRGYYGTAALAYDSVGLTTLSSWVYFNTGDTKAPTGAFTYPAEGASYYPGLDRIAGVASNGESGVNRVQCRLAWNDSVNGGWKYWNWASRVWEAAYSEDQWQTASGKETWEITSGLPDNWASPQTYGVLGRVYDNAGNIGNIPWLYFTVRETIPPSVTITSPQADTSYPPGTVAFAGTAADADSGVDKVTCMLCYQDADGVWRYWRWAAQAWEPNTPGHSSEYYTTAEGTENWTVQSGLPGTWPCNNQYYFLAVVYDKCSNTNSANVYFNIEDKSPPTVAITTPEQDARYLPGAAQFAGTASDSGAGLLMVRNALAYQDSAGGWNYWNWTTRAFEPENLEHWSEYYAIAEGTENWKIESGLPDTWPCCKRYWFNAIAFDKAGNHDLDYAYFYIGDQTQPTVTITTPKSGMSYLPGVAQFAGTASDAGVGLDKVTNLLAYQESVDVWKYWNWTTHGWEPYDQAHWADYNGTAQGRESWKVESGLPETWPCCKQYFFNAVAYDKCGNTAVAYVYFNIGDNVPPVISSITATPDTLWPPDHRMVDVQVTVAATDNHDPHPVSRITSVTCNEPLGAPGTGNTDVDYEITGDLTLRLRAERAGNSTARVYTINVTCTDACGNASTGSVNVTVPHDQGN